MSLGYLWSSVLRSANTCHGDLTDIKKKKNHRYSYTKCPYPAHHHTKRVISSNSEFLEEELTMTSLKQFFQDTPTELENVHTQNSILGAFLTLCDLH